MQTSLERSGFTKVYIPAAAASTTTTPIPETKHEVLPPGLLKKRFIKELSQKESASKEPRTDKPDTPNPDEEVMLTGKVEYAIPAAAAIDHSTLSPKFVEIQVNLANLGSLDKQYLAKAIDPEEIKVLDGMNYKIYDQSGELLAVYVKNGVDLMKHDAILGQIYAFSEDTSYFHSASRGAAAGFFDPSNFPKLDPQKWKIRKSGLKATYEGQTYNKGNTHKSGTIGYLGHNNNGKLKCRTAGMGSELLPGIEPLLNSISEIYRKCVPIKYEAQLKFLEEHRQYAMKHNKFHGQIGKTPFTTLTINVSEQGKPTTHIHRDKSNLQDSFVALLVDGGNFSGGETVFPELKDLQTGKMIAFSVNPGDLLFFDGAKLLHGNTPVKLLNDLADRVSIVAYAQKILASCTECPDSEKPPKRPKKLGLKAIERAAIKRASQKSHQLYNKPDQ